MYGYLERFMQQNPGEIDNWIEELKEVRNKMIKTTILKDSENENSVILLNDTETNSYSIGLKIKTKVIRFINKRTSRTKGRRSTLKKCDKKGC